MDDCSICNDWLELQCVWRTWLILYSTSVSLQQSYNQLIFPVCCLACVYRSTQVTVGGVFQIGNWNEHNTSVDHKGIWENACRLEPSLKVSDCSACGCVLYGPFFASYAKDGRLRMIFLLLFQHATIVGDWTGLRPYRSKVRLERETINCGSTTVEVCSQIHMWGVNRKSM